MKATAIRLSASLRLTPLEYSTGKLFSDKLPRSNLPSSLLPPSRSSRWSRLSKAGSAGGSLILSTVYRVWKRVRGSARWHH